MNLDKHVERRARGGGVTRMNGSFEHECIEANLTHEFNFVEWRGLSRVGTVT